MSESHGRSHASLHCTTFRRPAYQMVNWQLNMEVVQVVLGCRAASSDVKGFTNAAMAWMPKSGHGADGRLANHHGAPFSICIVC